MLQVVKTGDISISGKSLRDHFFNVLGDIILLLVFS